MNNKIDFLKFMEDLKIVNKWVGNNEDLDVNSRTIIITWLLKMATQLENNLGALLEMKEENKAEETTSEEN